MLDRIRRAEHIDHSGRHGGRCRGIGWTIRRRLDLDQQIKLPQRGEDRSEARNCRTIAGDLIGIARSILRSGAQTTDIIARELGKAEVAQQRRIRPDVMPRRIPRDRGVQSWIVMHHGEVVRGQADIELNPGHAAGTRHGKPADRVFRCQATRATMAENRNGPHSPTSFSASVISSIAPSAPRVSRARRACRLITLS